MKTEIIPIDSCKVIYTDFIKNLRKALIVATAKPNKEFVDLEKLSTEEDFSDIEKVFLKYGGYNIFFSEGLTILVSSLEVFLRHIFLEFIKIDNYKDELIVFCESKKRLPRGKSMIDIQDLVIKNTGVFNFQNLEKCNENLFKGVLGIDLKDIFDNEKRSKNFIHPFDDTRKMINDNGYYKYIIDESARINKFRHKITYEMLTYDSAKSIFLLHYESLTYFAKSFVEKIYGVDFDIA